MKGRKKTPDASKRLRGTDQPCRMDGELVQLAVKRYYNDLRNALDKEKSVQKIDGIVAGIMALGEWMTKQAYEELEAQHERITGKWMYAEYDTFRRVYKRWLKKEKLSPK